MNRDVFKNITFLLLLILGIIGCKQDNNLLIREWKENQVKGKSTFLTKTQLKKIGTALNLALKNPKDTSLSKTFSKVELHWKYILKEQLFILKEKKNNLNGHGFFLIRENETKPLLIQAPHGFYDFKTGEIAILLFKESKAKAVSLNTAHRKHFDLAKEKETLFSRFFKEFIKVEHPAIVLQLHGFKKSKRKTEKGRAAEIIVSSGSLTPRKAHRNLVASLKKYFGSGVVLYPKDVEELGGTKNSQGKALQNIKDSYFVHLELSRAIRERLYSSKEDRSMFIKSVMEVLK